MVVDRLSLAVPNSLWEMPSIDRRALTKHLRDHLYLPRKVHYSKIVLKISSYSFLSLLLFSCLCMCISNMRPCKPLRILDIQKCI